jgi:replicative DNA helicase
MKTINPDEFFRENLTDVSFAVNRALDMVDNMESGITGFKYGLSSFDDYAELMPGELTTIAARSGTGKTAIAMQVVYSVLHTLEESGKPGRVCIFSAEMAADNLMLREACAQEKIALWRLRKQSTSAEENQRIRNRLNHLRTERLLIDESAAPTLEHMLSQLQIVEEEYGKIAFIMFDYTELSGEFERNEGQRIAKISRGLKALAKKYNCPVLTLSQLNRDIEGRSDKTPTMRDLMHGGEREPDCIIIMVRPWLYDDAEQRELVYAHIVKNRNGPLGQSTLLFHDEIMRFESAELVRSEID